MKNYQNKECIHTHISTYGTLHETTDWFKTGIGVQ